jgi:2-keto-4-pentenoate hydratase/2-oxohepta-3-ene-1,7-dioic acid hydratase in catechol pathway
MQLVRYGDHAGGALGVCTAGGVVSVELAVERYGNPDKRLESQLGLVAAVLGREPKVLLSLGDRAFALVAEAVAADDGSAVVSAGLDGLTVLPFIHNPMTVLGVGYNSKALCEHENKPYPEQPEIFAKLPTCVIGPYQDVEVPKAISDVDFEAEVCVIIGRRCREVPADKALAYVGGYIAIDEACAKILPRPSTPGRTETLMLKGPDSMAPLGAVMVTPDEAGPPAALQVICRVNGEERQNYSLGDAVFGVETIIEWISSRITLHPGDLIAMGTGLGVGIVDRPPRLLRDGDVVECEIAGYQGCRNTFRIPGWKPVEV